MGQFLRAVREDYDVVICDGAPVMAVTDAAVVASQTDGTILVVGAGQTPREAAIHAKELLEQAKANILGVVLNKINVRDQKNRYYYYYYRYSEAE